LALFNVFNFSWQDRRYVSKEKAIFSFLALTLPPLRRSVLRSIEARRYAKAKMDSGALTHGLSAVHGPVASLSRSAFRMSEARY
jgi:hypothetical protein